MTLGIDVDRTLMFLGAYWNARWESKADCAARISNYLRHISAIEATFHDWLQKGTSRERAARPADISADGIYALLKTNNRDGDGAPIVELGFNLSLWNGTNASFSATIGSFSRHVGNSVVLSLNGDCPVDGGVWRGLIEGAVHVFEPDSAVVTSHEYIAVHGEGARDESGGWFTYIRGASIVENSFP